MSSENGWNDYSQDLMDFIETPSHSKAYLFGFSKIFKLNKSFKRRNVGYFLSEEF